MSIIKLSDIVKKYHNKIVLNKLSLEIKENELVAITGNSGCGKSTLLNIIGLIEPFNEGTLIIDGEKNIKPNSSMANKFLREKISYLFQNFALVDNETVNYNLELALKYNCRGKKVKAERISEALSFVGLSGYEDRYIYELSGGEQQRIAVARILLKPSKIILADEPTGSLDEENRDIILSLLQDLNKKGKTVIIVTHDKHVSSKCTRIINL